jgi:hypothetical protein
LHDPDSEKMLSGVCVLTKIKEFFLYQGQVNIFIYRQCKSIPYLENPYATGFPMKIRILVHFCFNTPIPFPESGSEKRFHASGMHAIDSLQKITSIGVFLVKIFEP